MEEVDTIILQFLKQLDISICEDIRNLCDLPVEVIIESASKCLSTINPALKLPPKLPSGISHRIEVAAQMASACKDLGYKNDVGYQTFLYYNETELRQVFMFLIEHLPSEGSKNSPMITPSKKSSVILQQIGQKIEEELNALWIPPCCYNCKKTTIGDSQSTPVSLSTRPHMNSIHFNESEIVAQLLKLNELTQSKETGQVDCKEENMDTSDVEPEMEPKIHESSKELKEMAIVLRQNLYLVENERNLMDTEFQQANKSLEKAQAELNNVKSILIGIGLENISDEGSLDNVLEKVQNNIVMLHSQSEQLTSINLNLKVEMNKLKNENNLLESERSKCRTILLSLKDTAKTLKDEYNNKEQQRDQLKRNYEKLKGGNKRSMYTKRILEIIGNVDKQNMEITKILEDTRQLQKEINTLEGQLDRCFSIADETLFGDAKKDDQAKKAYKLLALLHSECNTIVSLVNDTGTLAREIVDLEDNIKGEKTKRTEDTLERIRLDITKMQEESNVY